MVKARKALSIVVIMAMLVAVLPATVATAADGVLINEIQVSTTSSDWEFVELQGPVDEDLSGLTLVGVESDEGSSTGNIDVAISFTGSIGSDGFYVGMSPAGEAEYGVAGDQTIADNSFENSTATYFLVEGFTGAEDDDLDTDDDGVLDSTPWSAVHDSLNIRDGDAADFTYGAAAIVGPDGSFLPSGTFRCPDAPLGTFAGDIHDFSNSDGTPGAPNACPEPAVEVLISEVQGDGFDSPLNGSAVIIEGVVVGDFQGNDFAGDQLGGFFLQEETSDQDADPATSEGVFVFAPDVEVNVGDVVEVTGTVDEFFGLTEITDTTDVVITGTGSVPATAVSLPVSSEDDWEPVEGMLVTFEQDLVISEYFNFDRFNHTVLTTDRQYTPTQVAEPGSAEAAAIAEANALSKIKLDDGRSSSNPDPAIHPNGDEFTLTNTFRGGDVVQGVTGAVSYSFGEYVIHPTEGATHVVTNPRPVAPDRIRGNLRVASFNVLNFFTTIDDGPDVCGPTGLSDCRGADSQEEYDRQLAKLVAGVIALDADIVGLQEVENDIFDDDGSRAHNPVLTLVEELNAVEGDGTWAWIGELGYYNDYPIRNEIIYRTDSAWPVGAPQTIADEAFDLLRPGDFEPVGRPPVAQTFSADPQGRRVLTVVVNHFKSKGSACDDLGDPDLGDGQANCNLTRVAQSEALLDFVDDLQRTTGDRDVLIIGDLNSYAKEDPVDVIRAGHDGVAGTFDDFRDLLTRFGGATIYGYVFDGQVGSLDHALASPSLSAQVRGATVFNINADEPDILDYDTTFKKDAQDALYEPLPYRVSDHDPVIVGINLRIQR